MSKRFIVRLIGLLSNLLSRTYIPFLVLGMINRVFGLFKSTFLCYMSHPHYIRYYCFKRISLPLARWMPTPIAIFRQGDSWGLVLGVCMTEKDFLNPKNRSQLNKCITRLELISKLLGVNIIKTAGILTSYLQKICN